MDVPTTQLRLIHIASVVAARNNTESVQQQSNNTGNAAASQEGDFVNTTASANVMHHVCGEL